MVVKLFPDDALAGASHDSHSSMRGTRHGNLQYEMEYLRGDDQKDRGRCRGIYSDSAAHRNDVSYLDDQWRGSHINILWCTDHVADLFPTLRLHHLQHNFRDDGNLMDHHCHHRGIGDALGIPAPYTAGAIISGAYFGDKLSPMSDTTVLASSIAGADLFSHIRYMLYTTIPSILLSLVLYLIIGLCYDSKPVDISQYLTGLSHGFNISLLTMLVPVFTGWLIYRKTPSLITLLLSALSACICALILQPEVLVKIAGEDNITAKSLFEGIMTTCYTHTQVGCGMGNINELVATRGMAGMLNTIWLILCAMCFGSCMVASGMLHAITHMLLKSIHSTVSLVCSTVTSGVLLNLVMGDQFLSIIMNASIYKDEYAERGYRPELLSRSTEDSATVTSVLVPWTACGMTQSTVLGIPTLVYLPFCFFNIISPLMSCLVAILGFVPKPQPKEDKASAVEESDIH